MSTGSQEIRRSLSRLSNTFTSSGRGGGVSSETVTERGETLEGRFLLSSMATTATW